MKLTIGNGAYAIVGFSPAQKFEFTDSHSASLKLEELGVKDSAIDEAFKYLLLERTTEAHFGINGTFMFTKNKKGK